MTTKSTEEKVAIIVKGIRYRARKRFHEGNLENPFAIDGKHPPSAESAMRKGMYEQYEVEMDKLIPLLD